MGVVLAVATAAAVFGIGLLVLPPIEPAPPPKAAPTPPPPPPPAPPPPAPQIADAGSAAAPAPAPEPKSEPPAPKPAATAEPPAAAPAPSHDKQADKDVARDAWRKNLPDISTEPGKAAMLIPIKGSTEGATYHVAQKPRSVLIALPKGESMITMPFYSVKHDGFRQLWIKKDDDAGTSIRVVLGDASDPQVEIKDEFVRVTVRRPTDTSGTAGAPPGGAPGDAQEKAAPAGD